MTSILVMLGVFVVGISGLCFLMYLGACYFFKSCKGNKERHAPSGAR
jgi:hypothetical protein